MNQHVEMRMPGSQDRKGESAQDAVSALANRVLGTHAGALFRFEWIEPDDGRDVFELESDGGTVIVRGNSPLSMATGLNWYLRSYGRCDISWCGSNVRLPRALPRIDGRIRRVSWARHRYFLNYCCFCYSLAWWDWTQWEKLIDWMALNGVNLPLAVTGQEAVWQAVGRRLGLSDADMEDFFSGPPYLPFVWMGCMDGWAGPLPKGWIASHEELARRILARQRELGMTPVLQGFTGHVPPAVARKFPDARMNRVSYIEWETCLLDPLDELFQPLAAMFLEEQERRFGTDHFYAADTFIEMVPPSGDPDYLARLGRAIYQGMAGTDPAAVWVMQGWAFNNHLSGSFWTPQRMKALLDAVPDERMLLLDLFCESKPVWNAVGGDAGEAFCGKPWLWCNVQNFGRTVHLTGALERNNTGLMSARSDPRAGKLRGVGMVNEGLCYNPVAHELLFEQAWREGPVDLADWIRRYSRHRYGQENADAEAAWELLLRTAYTGFNFAKSYVAQKPDLAPTREPFYDHRLLVEAWWRLLRASDRLGDVDTYRFDLVNVGRQVLSNHAWDLHTHLVEAFRRSDLPAFREAAGRMLQLIRDMDGLVATREEFLLGRWLADARRWGSDEAEKRHLAWNARLVITQFGTSESLRDYARKEWAGMLRGFYLPRWELFIRRCESALEAGRPLDEKAVDAELVAWERQWMHQDDPAPDHPQGDAVEMAHHLWAQYEAVITS